MNIVFEFYYVFIRDTNEFTFSEFMRYISPFSSDDTFDVYVHLVSPEKKVVFRLFLNKDAFKDPDVMLNLYFSLFNRIKNLENDLLISSITSQSIPIALIINRYQDNYSEVVGDSQDDLALKDAKLNIEYKQYNYFIDDDDELIDLTEAFKEGEEGEGEGEGEVEGEGEGEQAGEQ